MAAKKKVAVVKRKIKKTSTRKTAVVGGKPKARRSGVAAVRSLSV